MKRILLAATLASTTLVSACGVSAVAPLQEVRAAAAKTSALHSFKLDLDFTSSGTRNETASVGCTPAGELPPPLAAGPLATAFAKMTPKERAAFCAKLARQAASLPRQFSLSIRGKGASQLPDRLRVDVTASVLGISVDTELIRVGDAIYVKNPVSGAWTTLDQLGFGLDASTVSQLDPSSALAFLDSAKSAKDLGDTTLDGVRVHHYRVELDDDKLRQQATSKPIFKDPKVQDLVRQYADSVGKAAYTLEVWIGTSDDLLRRELIDVTVNPAGSTSGAPALPFSDLKVHGVINFHDFNGKVTIEAPAVS